MRKNKFLMAAAAIVLVGVGGNAWAQRERGERAAPNGPSGPCIRMVESPPITDLRQALAAQQGIMVPCNNPRTQPSNEAKAHPIVWAKPSRTAGAAKPLAKLPRTSGAAGTG
jgi:hypothetical protein